MSPALINLYDHCHAYYGGPGYSPGNSPFAVIFWTIDNARGEIDIGYTCSDNTRLGYCALGITNDNNGMMLNSDPIINFYDFANNQGRCGDYHIGSGPRPDTDVSTTAYPTSNALGGINGVNRDELLGGTNDVTNCSAAAEFGGNKLAFQFTRPLTATDPYDIAIPAALNRTILVSARTYTTAANAFGYHNPDFRYATDAWNFYTPPGCPNGCTSAAAGVCVKGCCVCNAGYGGYDCRFAPGTTGGTPAPGSNTDLTTYEHKAKMGAVALEGKFNIHWTLSTTSLTIALEFEDAPNNTRWVGFGWGNRMDTGDAWIAQGPNFNNLADYYLGHDKQFKTGGVALDVAYGGTNDISGSVAYDPTTKKWIVSFTRLLETGDNFDRTIKSGWNDFIWAFGPKGHQSLSTKAHPYDAKWRGRINLTTGKVELKTDLRVAHGALMYIAFAVLMVAGAIVARYFKSLGSMWFHIHRACMWLALALMLAGFIIILVFVPKGSHFRRAHPRLGMTIVGLSVLQPFIGIAADLMFKSDRFRTPIFPDLIHWVVGWLIIILSLVNISLGIHLINASTVVVALWYVWMVGVIIANIALFCYFFFVKKFTGLNTKH